MQSMDEWVDAIMTLCLLGVYLVRDRSRILRRPVVLAAAVAAAAILLAALPFLHAWLAYPGPVQAARSVTPREWLIRTKVLKEPMSRKSCTPLGRP